MRVVATVSDGKATAQTTLDALKLEPPEVRLVLQWAIVKGEERPDSYCDVDLSQLEHVEEDLYVLTHQVIRVASLADFVTGS